MGASAGGAGREAEEFTGSGSAYGAHTVSCRKRQGEFAKLTLSGFCYTYLDHCYVLQHVVHELHTLFSEKL